MKYFKILFLLLAILALSISCSNTNTEKSNQLIDVINFKACETRTKLINSDLFKESILAEIEYLDEGLISRDTLSLIEKFNTLDKEFIATDFFNIIKHDSLMSDIPVHYSVDIKITLNNIKKNVDIILNSEIPLVKRIFNLSRLESRLSFLCAVNVENHYTF